MKELIHFTLPGSTVCDQMEDVIKDLLSNRSDILYTKINVQEDSRLYDFYSKKYSMPICPSFIGIVDGKVIDGHVGYASRMILESLVS
jgi:hypothetical protein